MELFFLMLLVLLVFLFQSKNAARSERIENELKSIQKALKDLAQHQRQQPAKNLHEKPITEYKASPPPEPIVIVPEIKIEEPVKENISDEVHPFPLPEVMVPPLAKEYKKPVPKQEPEEGFWDKFKKNNPDLEKFIGENLISKIGIVILVLGIAYFVKYAIDQDWINETARVGIGVLCGGVVMAFAHRLRVNFKAFSSVLVAGAVAIFYFTIAIGFHEYHLFGQTVAFTMMLFITAFSVFISVSYNRMELAALSLIGGFATPFMLSTGQGNYVVLFTYIMILDIGMLVLAYLRKWNLITIMAYVFTELLFGGWFVSKVMMEAHPPYNGALLFATLFYFTFVMMSIVYNIKERRTFAAIELSILISNTFLYYAFGMQVIQEYYPQYKGLFTIALALFNFVCSWSLYKYFKTDKKLVYSLIGLTLTFVTLAAPIQLDGHYITIFWAGEAVMLMWLAQRSQILSFRFASVVVHLLSFISLLMDWSQVYLVNEIPPAWFLNKAFITGLVFSSSLLTVVLLLKNEREPIRYKGIDFSPSIYGNVLKVAGVLFFYFSGLTELSYQFRQYFIGLKNS